MDGITVSNFRCFGDGQSARIAPITLLVGDNSTGKTSILALIRALWDVFYDNRAPDFGEPPLRLGSFDEVVHDNGGEGERPRSFTAGFTIRPSSSDGHDLQPALSGIGADLPAGSAGGGVGGEDRAALLEASVEFGRPGAAPTAVRRRVSLNGCSAVQGFDSRGRDTLTVRTQRGKWRVRNTWDGRARLGRVEDWTHPADYTHWVDDGLAHEYSGTRVEPLDGSPRMSERDVDLIADLSSGAESFRYQTRGGLGRRSMRPYVGAPIRSQPRRTYDPAWSRPDLESSYTPTYLFRMSLEEPEAWERLQARLEGFGQDSGLFDGIRVRHLGDTANDPFQIQIREADAHRRDSFRNLTEVGYGVSQILPMATELLRDDNPPMMLLQQPEVHLHPSAAAALGTLLCETAADRERERRLVVETHSDFIIDRVRMAARDGAGGLEPADIAILYFERCGPGVRIHTIGVDGLGNLLNAPASYREFFMEESRRFLGV